MLRGIFPWLSWDRRVETEALWVCERECEWVWVWECEWERVWVRVGECQGKRVCEWEWVSECECESVSEWGRECVMLCHVKCHVKIINRTDTVEQSNRHFLQYSRFLVCLRQFASNAQTAFTVYKTHTKLKRYD